MFTFSKVVVWLIVGALAGSFTGMIVMRRKEGFGRWANLGLGLVGAVLGGFLFQLVGIDLGLGEFSVSFEDLIAAVSGSVLFLIIVQLIRMRWSRKKGMNG